MSFQRPTLAELIQRAKNDLNSRLPGTDATLRRSNTNAIAIMHSGATHGLYGYLAYIVEQLMFDTAEGDYLERWASFWDVTRKPAEYATGSITITGTSGSVVPAGTEFKRSDGTIFTLDEEATLVDGTAIGTVTAAEAGVDGNTDTGVSLSLINPIEGVTSAATVASDGLVGGVDEEDDDYLRDRFLARVRQAPQGGNDDDYETWALEVSGVTRAWCIRQQFGGGTVGLTFVCDDQEGSIIPDAAKVAEVAAYIETKRPVTDDPTVYAPEGVPLNPVIQITPETAAVKAAVQAELEDLIAREAEPGGTIYISRLNEAISVATGEEDHVLVSPSANVTHEVGQIAILGTVTWA